MLDKPVDGNYSQWIRTYHESNFVKTNETNYVEWFDGTYKPSIKEHQQFMQYALEYGYNEAGNRAESLALVKLGDWLRLDDDQDKLDPNVNQEVMNEVDPHPDINHPDYERGCKVRVVKIKEHKTPQTPLYIVCSKVFYMLTLVAKEFTKRTFPDEPDHIDHIDHINHIKTGKANILELSEIAETCSDHIDRVDHINHKNKIFPENRESKHFRAL